MQPNNGHRSCNLPPRLVDQQIIDVLREDHPQSVRHVFYRMTVPRLPEPVEKSDRGYRHVQDRVKKLRRDGRVPDGWIADATRRGYHTSTYIDASDFLRTMSQLYRGDLWANSDRYVEVWCESRSIAGVIQRTCEELAVSLYPCGGFSSITLAYEAAQEKNRQGEAGRTCIVSMSAKEAVLKLLAEIVKVQLMKSIMGLPSMGKLASAVGGALIPGYATGGDHRGGLRIVGERGPELEATGAARIWNAEQTRKMLNPSRPTPASVAQPQGGTSKMEVSLSPDLVGRVLDQAKQQSINVTLQAIRENNGNIPRIMREYQQRIG